MEGKTTYPNGTDVRQAALQRRNLGAGVPVELAGADHLLQQGELFIADLSPERIVDRGERAGPHGRAAVRGEPGSGVGGSDHHEGAYAAGAPP